MDSSKLERRKPSLLSKATSLAFDIANGRHDLSKAIAPVLFAADTVLGGLIIWKIPYTEIDWEAYMAQVSQYLSGERDYSKIRGGTGPLVYPAAHVYMYAGLYRVTDEGRDVLLAQQLFAVVYMATLALVMACYRKAGAPPYVLPLLVLSKRLHSIFVLRCFNDGLAVLFLWLSLYALQRRSWTLAALAYSWGLGVKMTLLLPLPAILMVLFLGRGFWPTLRLAWLMTQLQVLIGLPFLAHAPRAYLGRAFEFSRQFLFKWTVNWRFIGEETFLSRTFAITLLVLHVSVLATFAITRWIPRTGKSLAELAFPLLRLRSPVSEREKREISARLDARFTMSAVLGSTVVGLLFARSLHYQFYAYLAWATPFLLWRSGIHPVLQYALWGLQEWAWNVYPSTTTSSLVVVGVLAVTVFLAWWDSGEEGEENASKGR